MKLQHFIRPSEQGSWQVYTDHDAQGEQIGPVIRYTTRSFEHAQQKAQELDNHEY